MFFTMMYVLLEVLGLVLYLAYWLRMPHANSNYMLGVSLTALIAMLGICIQVRLLSGLSSRPQEQLLVYCGYIGGAAMAGLFAIRYERLLRRERGRKVDRSDDVALGIRMGVQAPAMFYLITLLHFILVGK